MINNRLPQRELEMLSAYIDGELKPGQIRKVEARLEADPAFREALQDLQALSRSLRALPTVKPPRSFILSKEMMGLVERPAGYPILRLATALAAFAFVVLVGFDVFSSMVSGAMPARMMDQVIAEAPAAAELQLEDAAKSEALEAEGEMAAAPSDLPGEEVPAEEESAEGLAAAEPAAEGEAAAEERALGEAAAEADAPLIEPETTELAQDELQPGINATAVADEERLAAQVEPAQPVPDETFAETERRVAPPVPWIRIGEAGLALLTIVLGGYTLWVRARNR